MNSLKVIALTASLAIGGGILVASPASALPLTPATGGSDLRASVDATSPLIAVRRGYGRGWGWGAAGFGTGLLLGGALASPYYYRPYYYGPPAYYAPPPAYYSPSPYAGDAVAYCSRRYRSYDPASGTFLGYDGVRHPCP